MIYHNYIRVLYIDVESGSIRVVQREDLVDYLGGVGVASKLLEENMKVGLDPLDEGQPVVFAIGALSSIFPVITKTVAMFISPLTGELGESYAGGRLALALFNAGYDAVVITGKSAGPIYIVIDTNDVILKDARVLWNTSADETGRIIRERETGGGKRSIIRIGKAGENLVSFASVCVDTYRHFGRLGLGACLGSKHIKAISVIGGRDIPIKNSRDYFRCYSDIYKKCTKTEMMEKYHDAGTPINIEPLNALGGLPTLNLQSGHFGDVSNISGDAFATNHLVRKMACTGCPVGCIHIGQYRKMFSDDGYEYQAISVGYDYELIYALGTFLGIDKAEDILALINVVEEMGLDAMSTGVVLGWASEAYSEGILTLEQTLVPLTFGDALNYENAIVFIARGSNQFYQDLGKGVTYASKIYGGIDFAMAIAGNEMPGYHTGYGSLVGAAIGARHSHLCNGGYSIDQGMKEFNGDMIVEKLFNEEVERCMLNSLIICLFARKIYDRTTILSAFKAIGVDMDDDKLSGIASKIYATKLRIKQALGFKLQDIKLPKRFFETPSMHGVLEEEVAMDLIKRIDQKNKELLDAN